MKAVAGVRWVTFNEARQVLEVDEARFREIVNDPRFPQTHQVADTFLLRLDELEKFILRTEPQNETPPR